MKNLRHLVKCYCCHKPLLQERVINGNVTDVLHPEHSQTEFILNNGSRMPVVICLTCKSNMDLNNPILQNSIMNNVINGWQEEQNHLMEKGIITQQQADDCMSLHKSFSILFKSHGLNDYQIKQRLSK